MDDQAAGTRKRHIFAVSDATGATCEMVVQAALSQFRTTEVVLERVSHARTPEQVAEIIDRAARVNGVVIYTMVSAELRRLVSDVGRNRGVSTVDILGPILTRLSDLLEISPLAQPGLFRQLNQEYFQRIEAVDYTVKHDDGMGLGSLDRAEIVLVGVSRTSKTPVSMYLSYRGWKVANVPIVPAIPPPEELWPLDQARIVALTADMEWLQLIRQERARYMGAGRLGDYTSEARIEEELDAALRVFRQRGWPVINVSHRSIEETATEVMKKIYARSGARTAPPQAP